MFQIFVLDKLSYSRDCDIDSLLKIDELHEEINCLVEKEKMTRTMTVTSGEDRKEEELFNKLRFEIPPIDGVSS